MDFLFFSCHFISGLVAPTSFFTGPTFAGNSGYQHFTGTVTGVTGVYRQFFTGHPQQV